MPSSYQRLMEEAEARIDASLEGHPKARKMWDLLRADPEVNACWDMADYITTAKLRYNDHGEVHAKVVAANALRMLDLLLDAGVLPDVVADGGGDEDDAHLIVLAGGLLHDIGNQVHRREHNVAWRLPGHPHPEQAPARGLREDRVRVRGPGQDPALHLRPRVRGGGPHAGGRPHGRRRRDRHDQG